MYSRKYVGDLKKKNKKITTLPTQLYPQASHKAEKNLIAHGRAILTKPPHL